MLYLSKCGSLFHDIKQFFKGVYFRVEGFDLAEAISGIDERDACLGGCVCISLGVSYVYRGFQAVALHDKSDVLTLGFAGDADAFTVFEVFLCMIAGIKALNIAVLTITHDE